MKTLLVTTDLSPESFKAFPIASELARALNAKVVLLTVTEDPAQRAMLYGVDFPVLPDPSLETQILAKITSELQNIVKKHFGSLPCEPLVKVTAASTYREIIKQAEEIEASMIITATHGRTGVKHFLMGSTAERIVRESPIPVVIVPAKL